MRAGQCAATGGTELGKTTIRSFQSIVGSLLWVARCTRPDIAFAVQRATRQTHVPHVRDWKLAKRIARYLSRSKMMKLEMRANNMREKIFTLESYSDADFAADKGDRKSLTGSMVLLT